MKVKDLVPVVINKVQLYYKAEDGSSPVYEIIGEACHLADMPEELLELEVVLVSALRIVDSLLLDIEVVYTDKDYFAKKFEALAQKLADINKAMTEPEQEGCTTQEQEEQDIRKLESENQIMRKALQAIAAYDIHKYIPESLSGILAESPYAGAYNILQGYAETALEDMERGLRYHAERGI